MLNSEWDLIWGRCNVINSDEFLLGKMGPGSNMTGVFVKRGNLDTERDMHRGKMV